jgi:serine O-acetyltransferase
MDSLLRSVPADDFWSRLHVEARAVLDKEPHLIELLSRRILDHDAIETAIAGNLAGRLSSAELSAKHLQAMFDEVFAEDQSLGVSARTDLIAIKSRDPACKSYLAALLYFGGFLALQAHRIAHWLWHHDRHHSALYLQGRVAETFGIDIHPAARMGSGIMIDHGSAVVIGETAVVEDGVSLLHEVTLGGRGKTSGDRHPKVRQGVSIGAGAKILGNIEIGAHARIGAGSVVLTNVAPFTTVIGIPGRAVGPIVRSTEASEHVPRAEEAGRRLARPTSFAPTPSERS